MKLRLIGHIYHTEIVPELRVHSFKRHISCNRSLSKLRKRTVARMFAVNKLKVLASVI
jgi:hypothetical protein